MGLTAFHGDSGVLSRTLEDMTTAPQHLRAGNVGRVSKDGSGEARSVSEQHAENQAVIEASGWQLAGTYEDVMSASRFAPRARKDWPRLVADVEAGRLDVVILWEPSRGSRKLSEWVTLLDLCRDKGVLIHVTTHRRTYDLTVWNDRKSLVGEATEAEGESEKTSDRTRRALAANAEAGMPHSPAGFGYRRVYAPRKERLKMDVLQVPEPAEAAVVAKVVAMVAANVPLSQVERETGVKRSTIRKWCYSPTVVGKRRTPAGLVGARWEPIVSEEAWRTAQAVLAAKPNTGPSSRPGGAKYLLSGIMTCCECGKPLEADPPGRGRGAAYTCRAGHVSIAMAGADDVIRNMTLASCMEDDLYQALAAASGDDAGRARDEAVRLQGELDEWLDSGISARAYKAKEDQLLPLIATARERAEALTVPAAVRDLVARGADVAAKWEAMTVPQRRAAVRFLFAHITLQRSPRPGPGVPAKDRITCEWRSIGEA